MKDTLTMSYRETDRLKIISRIEQKDLTIVEAAEDIQLSERQMYCMIKRYRTEGGIRLTPPVARSSIECRFPKER